MQSRFIRYKASVIHFFVFGNGPGYLFCLHGFGQSGSSFQIFEKELAENYTLFAMDFPFHGKTEWKEGLLMTPDDLLAILAIIMNENIGTVKNHPTFSVLAYSLGGRIALHLLQKVLAKIEKLVLVAPDGLTVNFWYWLGTQTWAGNKLFAYTMKKPYWFFTLLSAAYKLGLLNKSIIKFVHLNIDDENTRLVLYKRWTTLRRFTPNRRTIKRIMKEKQIKVCLVFGSYDRIILSKRSNFLKKNNEQLSVTVVEGGHELLKEKFSQTIALLLQQ
ncbi:MAG TPA: alpha/beta hydrolase [Panacibacter sp.]|nr:alpha/beta hydrolase [Panacibacter sp.]